MSYPDFRLAIAHFLGYGGTASVWSTEQVTLIAVILNDGLRQCYVPPALPGEKSSHRWSFLQPTSNTITTAADDGEYDTEDDHGGIIGEIYYAANEGIEPIKEIPESVILEKRMKNSGSGTPTFFAIRPKDFDPTTGQRYEILLQPKPSSVWTLSYKMRVLAEPLSATNIYARGGMEFSTTVMASMIAAAEVKMNDEHGDKWTDFMLKLKESVDTDRSANTPRRYGVNRDNSDGRDEAIERHTTGTGNVTVGGTQF